MGLLDWLKQPEIKSIIDLDDPSATVLHREILQKKTFLKKFYENVYGQFKNAVDQPEKKVLVEIGSGGGFIKDVMPNVITSEILNIPGVDKVFSATEMPFKDSSVDAFFMLDVLHHINEPRQFFKEAIRCLKPCGRIVMVEPANTAWARFVYTNFHHETFDPKAGWGLEKTGPLTQSNGAMPWIIFRRDKKIFENEFPALKIIKIRNHTPFSYLMSGGFTLRQLAPGFFYPAVRGLEYLLSPANNLIGMFMTIILEKAK